MSSGIDFEAWYERHALRLVATLTVAIGDEHDAQDAVAEACAKAYVRWARVGTMANPAGWVYVVALRDVHRLRARRDRRLPDARRHYEPPPAADQAVWSAVQTLPDRMRLAVTLRYLGDMTEAEVGHIMSISRGGAASLLHKARALLRTKLETEVLDDDHR